MSSGHRYAIVLRNEGGSCSVLTSLEGNPYTRGGGVFRRASDPPDGWYQFLDFGETDDLGFRTMVEEPGGGGGGSSGPCVVNGLATPFPSWVPVCRCLQDEGLRDHRCALFHPELVFLRNVPFIKPGEPFMIRWTLIALAPMKGTIELTETLPKGFQSSQGPLLFAVDQLAPGQSITLEYKAVAGTKGGRVESIVRLPSDPNGARMQTVIEVEK